MKMSVLEARALEVEDLADVVTFLFGNCTADDEASLRAMIVWGATRDQITRALAVSAVKARVKRDDKMTYAFGVVKNLMMENKP